MKLKSIIILVLIAMLVFSGVVMAAVTYIEGPIDGSGQGGTCPQDDPWTKIDSETGSETGDWGSFSYSGNTLTYEVNQNYTLYLCIKYANTNDGWVIEGYEAGSVTTQTEQEISHVSWYFLYDPPEEECEWVGETAWASGPRYVTRGNWATYTPYVADSPVPIYAGRTIHVGDADFSAVDDGKVTITITLFDGVRLELDEFGEIVEEAVKIQGYDEAPPAANPAPGRFTTYKGTDLIVTVPAFNYYGIHLNVEVEVCP